MYYQHKFIKTLVIELIEQIEDQSSKVMVVKFSKPNSVGSDYIHIPKDYFIRNFKEVN
jgi:hypothetical protein